MTTPEAIVESVKHITGMIFLIVLVWVFFR